VRGESAGAAIPAGVCQLRSSTVGVSTGIACRCTVSGIAFTPDSWTAEVVVCMFTFGDKGGVDQRRHRQGRPGRRHGRRPSERRVHTGQIVKPGPQALALALALVQVLIGTVLAGPAGVLGPMSAGPEVLRQPLGTLTTTSVEVEEICVAPASTATGVFAGVVFPSPICPSRLLPQA